MALHVSWLHICRFNQSGIKNIFKKDFQKVPKGKTNLLHTGNYLHSIYIAVGVKSDLERKVKSLSHVQLFATPWTVACQAPPSRGFSRQEYWSGLPFSSPEDLPDPGFKPQSPTLQADSLPSEPQGKLISNLDII